MNANGEAPFGRDKENLDGSSKGIKNDMRYDDLTKCVLGETPVRAIVVLFDTLVRNYVPPYGGAGVHAPNFQRLAERTVAFDTCYAGSLPCMPARRELHTGRYNFLHRNWGPLEPFDESMPEILSHAGVYTHLVTDHAHYWEDGGCTYHTRYDSWEGVRGQQGDRWKGHVEDPVIPDTVKVPMKPDGRTPAEVWRYDWVNREYFTTEETYPGIRTFSLGTEFIEKNWNADNWMLQIETFDPHEPFLAPDRFKQMYPDAYAGPHYDWPRGIRDEDDETVEHVRNLYRARVSMCDENLGTVLDAMDRHDMWNDTMLIVFSDHGFLLGEHRFWGKNGTAMYEEIAHTPCFIWDPRCGEANTRRSALVQTIDLGPTLLDFFSLPLPDHAQGRPLRDTIQSDAPVRDYGLFGVFGEQVCITDGRYVYMRYPATRDNAPLSMYTLMPNNMFARFSPQLIKESETVRPKWEFTKGCPLLKTPGRPRNTLFFDKHSLYDLDASPTQEMKCEDLREIERMEALLIRALRESDAPGEQFVRLGLDSRKKNVDRWKNQW